MVLISKAGPTRAAMVGYLMPIFATGLSIAFLGEHVGLREVAGGAIILTGVWFATSKR
jgi:drug/metabolite transporter (DMT)-like permease